MALDLAWMVRGWCAGEARRCGRSVVGASAALAVAMRTIMPNAARVRLSHFGPHRFEPNSVNNGARYCRTHATAAVGLVCLGSRYHREEFGSGLNDDSVVSSSSGTSLAMAWPGPVKANVQK
jgi:hypothetical protein